MSIIKLSDFDKGRYRIPRNQNQNDDLQIQIDYVENYYLKRLFGIELYELFIEDLALPTVDEPTAARFVKVYNPFDYQDSDEEIYSSEGIKEMLKGLIYFYYIRDLDKKPTSVGTKQTESDNSKNVSPISIAISRYNEAVDTFRAIQLYMDVFDNSQYPEYKGICIEKAHGF